MIWKRFFLNIVLGSGLLVLAFLFLSFIKLIALPPTTQQVFAQVQEGQEPLESFGDLNPVQEGQVPLEDNSEPVVGIHQRQVITIPAEAGEFGDAVPAFQEGQVPLEEPSGVFVPVQEGQVPLEEPPVQVPVQPPPRIVESPPVIVERVEQPIIQPVVEQTPVVIQQSEIEQVPVAQPVVITPPQQPAPVVIQPPVQQIVPQPDTQQVITDVDNTNLTSVRNDVSNNNTNTNTNTNNQTVSVGGGVPVAAAPAVVVQRVAATPAPAVVLTKPQVVVTETLPKTGPPLYFWVILGLIPLGLMLGRFAAIKRLAENGNYFWEQKQFIKKNLTP